MDTEYRSFDPGDTEFRISADNDERLEGAGKKKKKKLTPEWLAKILRTKDGETGELKESRASRFVESFKSLFGLVSGIERQEIVDGSLEYGQSKGGRPEYSQRSDLPFYSGMIAARELSGAEQLDNNAQKDETAVPGTEQDRLDDNKLESIYSSDDQNIGRGLNNEVDAGRVGQDSATADVVDLADGPASTRVESSLPLGLDIEQSVMMEANAAKMNEENVADYNQVYSSEGRRKSKDSSSYRPEPLSVLALDRLSRSRDERLRRRTVELRKKIDKLDNEHKQAVSQLQEVRADIERDRLSSAQSNNYTVKTEQGHVVAKGEAVQRVETGAVPYDPKEGLRQRMPQEVIYKEIAKSDYEAQLRRIESEPDPELRSRTLEVGQPPSAVVEKNRVTSIQEIVEQAAEQDIALEAYYERRHEVKDEPASIAAAVGSSVASVAPNSNGVHSQGIVKQIKEELRTSPKPKSPLPLSSMGDGSLYQQAMAKGATAGIILLVSFLIVVLFGGLL